MKKIKYIKFLVAALLLGSVATSCMDDDWNTPNSVAASFFKRAEISVFAMRSSSMRYLNTESYIGFAMFTIIRHHVFIVVPANI